MIPTLFSRRFLIALLVSAFAVGTGGAQSGPPVFTQTYSPADPVPCEGLALDGVTYSFTVGGAPSLDCVARTMVGPGTTDNIEAPNVEGTSAGILHLTFDVPTTVFGFGVARSIVVPDAFVSDRVIVDLFRPGAGLLREELTLDPTSDPTFTGGRFEYRGPAVKTVTIAFVNPPVTRFAVDNVTYFRPPGRSK